MAGWDELLVASGNRRFAGQAGVWYDLTANGGGKVICNKAPQRGIDANLFGCLKVIVDALNMVIVLTSVDTGGHVVNSRHYDGRAVDIGEIYAVGSAPKIATLDNSDAVEYVTYCLDHGFYVGEGRPRPGIIFGPPGHKWNKTQISHRSHCHQSLPKRRAA